MDEELLARIAATQRPCDVPAPSDENLAEAIRSFKYNQTDWWNRYLLDHIADRVAQLVKEKK